MWSTEQIKKDLNAFEVLDSEELFIEMFRGYIIEILKGRIERSKND